MDKRNDNKSQNIRKGPVERDGVIYTPSSYDEADLGKTQVIPAKEVRRKIPEAATYTKKVPSRKRGTGARQKKNGFALFFITTVFIGVLICVFVGAMFFNAWIKKTQGTTSGTPTPATGEPNITEGDDKLTAAGIGIISSIDSGKQSVEVLDAETGNAHTLFVEGATELRDKSGTSLTFAEFEIGDIVDIQFKKSNNILVHLKIYPMYWEHTEVSKVAVNTEAKSIAYAAEKYSYDDSLICTYKDKEFKISELTDAELVTIRGVKDKALFVDVVKKHGIIALEENKEIINGTVEIDTSYSVSLEPREIKVLEGRHEIVIKGVNIEPYIYEITVDAGEKYKLNLSELVFKAGTMSFKISEPDVKLTVNGVEVVNTAEPLNLSFGEYKIVAEKEGFAKYEQTVNFDTAELEVEIVMERIAQVSAITISTEPEGARVYVDDQYVGISPVTVSVAYGSHMVTIRKDGYIVVEIPFDVSIESIYRNVILRSLSDY